MTINKPEDIVLIFPEGKITKIGDNIKAKPGQRHK